LPLSGSRSELDIELADPGGGRWVTAVALDSDGLVSLPSSIQLPGLARPRGTLRAVLVGVDLYEDARLPRLGSAKVDARGIAAALAATKGRAFADVQTTTLLDAEATPADITRAIESAVRATGPLDAVLFYFAGHGVDGRSFTQPEAGLVLTATKTRLSSLRETSTSWSSLAGKLSAAQGTVIVILDACRTGLAGEQSFSTNDDAVSVLFTHAGAPMDVLAGSKGRQDSLETPNGRGGMFTNALISVIARERARYDRDKSGLIDLGELYSAVKAQVVGATKGAQTPWLARNDLVGEMSLF
jgi:uncharacterized caspase-like protein